MELIDGKGKNPNPTTTLRTPNKKTIRQLKILPQKQSGTHGTWQIYLQRMKQREETSEIPPRSHQHEKRNWGL